MAGSGTPTISVTPESSISPFPIDQWSAVVSGNAATHTCGIKSTGSGGGSLFCWGANDYGQLGLGYVTSTICSCISSISSSPVQTGVIAAALGAQHTCALLSGGTVVCWGGNSVGQLGLGYTSTNVLTVSAVPTVQSAVAISAGDSHTCAATISGVLYCWGNNFIGQLGNGGTDNLYSPVVVAGVSTVSAVACGYAHTCVLRSSGGVYCWGDNEYGQLGTGDTTNVASPPSFPAMNGVIALSVGNSHTCVLTSGADLYCWGYDPDDELGLGYAVTSGCSCVAAIPASPVLRAVSQVSAGGYHTCALQAGAVTCWGYNKHGQVGNGFANNGASVGSPLGPVVTGVALVSSGEYHTCVLTTGGAISCWGSNVEGELGTGDTTDVYAPATLSATPTPTISVSSSCSASITLSATKSVTPTKSVSITPATSRTASVSPSVSSSLTSSLTSTGSSSASASATPSWSGTTSPTGTLSSTRTSSGSTTPSQTGTTSASPSMTGTASTTPSVTFTASVTASASSSVTPSTTASPSVTLTVTPSHSVTPSCSATLSGTPSPSYSATLTTTASCSPTTTVSQSGSATATVTGSASVTGTASVSPTTSQSGTVSASSTVTSTSSMTASLTITSTVTTSASPSASGTLSASITTTATTTSSVTVTVTLTSSQSSTETGSVTATMTASASATASTTSSTTTTSTRSGTASVTVSSTVTTTASVSGSTTGSASPSPTSSCTATGTPSVTLSVTGTATPTETSSTSGTSSASGTDTTTGTVSGSGSVTASASGSVTASPTATTTFTVSPTGSSTSSATATLTPTVSGTRTSSVTATCSPTPSVTPSPCPAGCSACVSTNCTACFSGPQWQLGYAVDEARYACVPAVAVSPSFACGVAEASPAGTGVACPSLPTGVALSLSPLTQSGVGHPFIITTARDGSISLAVGPSVASLPLDYGVTPQYNITLSMCVPQAIAAFSGPGLAAAYSLCEAAQHMDTSATVTIDLSPINKPPVFTLSSLSLSTPGVASPGDIIGFPLSLYAVNPNTVAPWNTLTFSVTGGRCGAPASQSPISTLPWLPFNVSATSGSLVYTSAVTASSLGLQAWANPLFACATATNAGGLNASITITVTFTAVAARLSVFPTAIAVTHYALGVSSSSATVSLYVGSQAGLTWSVWDVVGSPWLLAVKASDTLLALSVNSSRLGSDWQVSPVQEANVTLTTSDGLLTATVSVTLRLSIPVTALSPPSLSQLVRQGGTADTSVAIANTGTGLLAYRIVVTAPWVMLTQDSTGTVTPGASVSVSLRANAGSMAPSLYPTVITIQTNVPEGVAADPTAASSFETGSVLSLPWELRVVQALLFPTELTVTVTPGSPPAATSFSLVNFAGSPILALLPEGLALSVSASAPSVTVAQSQLGAFTLAAVYPTDASGAYALPGQYSVKITIPCWKEAANSDTVNVTAGSQVSPLARSDISYVPITLPQITVHMTAVSGAPNATFSSVTLTTPSTTQVRVPAVLWVSVRDAGNFSVPFDSAFDAVSLSFNASGGVTPLQLESAAPVSLNDSGNNIAVEYTLLPVALGLVTIHVTVGGVPVPGGVVAVTVLGPVCTGDLVLDPGLLTCVCASGLYKDSSACVPCPAGSYNPSPGNGSVVQCLSCPSGWYCERGSVAVTAPCPSGQGFDCSDGTLRTKEGYWTPIPVDVSRNATWALYVCDNPHACTSARVEPGAVQCAPGYAGSVCGKCAPGYVGVGTFCVQCHYPGLSAVGVAVLPLVTVMVVGLLTVLLLDEKGVKRVRAMWIPAHSGTLFAELRMLFDFVQVVTLQTLIHAREYQWFVAGVLSLTGAGLGGGLGVQTWQPFLCVLFSRESQSVYWAQLGVMLLAFPLAAAAATVSLPLSLLVWQDEPNGKSRHGWWPRFVISLMLMQWAVMMSMLRAVVSQPERDGAKGGVGIFVLAVYGSGAVVVSQGVLYRGKRFKVSSMLSKLVATGYKRNRSLFEVLLLARKCGLICIAVLVKDPILSSLLALLSSLVVWMVAVIWKPIRMQMQLRLLQTMLLSLHMLMLLQASGQGRQSTVAALHALWLALLCVVLCAGVYSAGMTVYKILHPPATLVQNGLRVKRAKSREVPKFASPATFRDPWRRKRDPDQHSSVVHSRKHRVGRAAGTVAQPPVSVWDLKGEALAAAKPDVQAR